MAPFMSLRGESKVLQAQPAKKRSQCGLVCTLLSDEGRHAWKTNTKWKDQ
jgi:hypothetical protein